ncbi:hypothetical protein COO60DRAFT_176640 [Scenedesmus sp. NREL 46B-D3]|nr:hypothetical protein COO60DRAFT_176640 [Scenedesmus sp. NREL 46B-D3]
MQQHQAAPAEATTPPVDAQHCSHNMSAAFADTTKALPPELGTLLHSLLPHADQQAARLSCKAFATALDPHITRISVELASAVPVASSRSHRLHHVSHMHARVGDADHWRPLQALTSQLPALSNLAVGVDSNVWPGIDTAFFNSLAALTAVTRLHLHLRSAPPMPAELVPQGVQLPAVRVAAFKTSTFLELSAVAALLPAVEQLFCSKVVVPIAASPSTISLASCTHLPQLIFTSPCPLAAHNPTEMRLQRQLEQHWRLHCLQQLLQQTAQLNT